MARKLDNKIALVTGAAAASASPPPSALQPKGHTSISRAAVRPNSMPQ